MTISVPIDPYNLLYFPKLLTKKANPIEVSKDKMVATTAPVVMMLLLFLFAGAKKYRIDMPIKNIPITTIQRPMIRI